MARVRLANGRFGVAPGTQPAPLRGKIKNPSPPMKPDRRRRAEKRQEARERQLADALTKQGRVIDVDIEMWIEQAARADVNLQIIKAAKSRNREVPYEWEAKDSTDL